MTDIVLSPDNSSMIVELIKGQAAAATELRLQNARLFGGDGQPGAIHLIMDQHRALDAKLDKQSDTLLDKIETNKNELSAKTEEIAKVLAEKTEQVAATLSEKIDSKKKEQDDRISEVEKKQYWMSGAGTVVGITLGWVGSLLGKHS